MPGDRREIVRLVVMHRSFLEQRQRMKQLERLVLEQQQRMERFVQAVLADHRCTPHVVDMLQEHLSERRT